MLNARPTAGCTRPFLRRCQASLHRVASASTTSFSLFGMASVFAGHCSVQLSQLIDRSVLHHTVSSRGDGRLKNQKLRWRPLLCHVPGAFHVVIIRDRSLIYNTHDIRSVGACETVQDTRCTWSVWPVELRVRAFLILSDRAKTSQMDSVGPGCRTGHGPA